MQTHLVKSMYSKERLEEIIRQHDELTALFDEVIHEAYLQNAASSCRDMVISCQNIQSALIHRITLFVQQALQRLVKPQGICVPNQGLEMTHKESILVNKLLQFSAGVSLPKNVLPGDFSSQQAHFSLRPPSIFPQRPPFFPKLTCDSEHQEYLLQAEKSAFPANAQVRQNRFEMLFSRDQTGDDIIVIRGGQMEKIHCAIFSLSPVYRQHKQCQWRQTPFSFDVEKPILNFLLDYMYLKRLPPRSECGDDFCTQLLKAANFLQLEGLRQHLTREVFERVNESNFVQIIVLDEIKQECRPLFEWFFALHQESRLVKILDFSQLPTCDLITTWRAFAFYHQIKLQAAVIGEVGKRRFVLPLEGFLLSWLQEMSPDERLQLYNKARQEESSVLASYLFDNFFSYF